MKYIKIFRALALLSTVVFGSCMDHFLDARPDKKLVVPATVNDLLALLDNANVMNLAPGLGEVSADDYFLPDTRWTAITSVETKNAYVWSPDIYEGTSSVHWYNTYLGIFYANTVLDKLKEMDVAQEGEQFNMAGGAALFYRAWLFYHALQQYAKPYEPSNADTDLGIPMPLIADVNEKVFRPTVADNYRQIVNDLENSLLLLPLKPLVKTRPSKLAAYALLAKAFLQMHDYERAQLYADSCILSQGELVDYNTLDLDAAFPFSQFNDEVIFHATLNFSASGAHYVDTVLYDSYADNDLRKQLFFRDNNLQFRWGRNDNDLRKQLFFRHDGDRILFKGNYTGTSWFFGGLALDEQWLISAECMARQGNSNDAVERINALWRNRFRADEMEGLPVELSSEELLDVILEEKRKQLAFRGTRWEELRRLNLEPNRAVDIIRMINGQRHILEANSNRYTLPIPDDVIAISGVPQNPR